jgi:hypothetical protein
VTAPDRVLNQGPRLQIAADRRRGLETLVEVALVDPTTRDRRADARPATTMPGGSR